MRPGTYGEGRRRATSEPAPTRRGAAHMRLCTGHHGGKAVKQALLGSDGNGTALNMLHYFSGVTGTPIPVPPGNRPSHRYLVYLCNWHGKRICIVIFPEVMAPITGAGAWNCDNTGRCSPWPTTPVSARHPRHSASRS